MSQSLSTVLCIDTTGGLWIYGNLFVLKDKSPILINSGTCIRDIVVCRDILWILDINDDVWAHDIEDDVWAYDAFNEVSNTENITFIKMPKLTNILLIHSNQDVVTLLDYDKVLWELKLSDDLMDKLHSKDFSGNPRLRHHCMKHSKISIESLNFNKIKDIPNIISISSKEN